MSAAPSDAPSGLSQLTEVLRRRWVVVAAVVGLVVVAAVGRSLLQSPTYRASANVLLERQNLGYAVTGTPEQPQDAQALESRAETQVSLARNQRVVSAALPPGRRSPADVRDFLRHGDVSRKPNTDLMLFRFDAPAKARAVATANAWASSFSDYRERLDTAPLSAALAGLERELRSPSTGAASGQGQAIEQRLRTLLALRTSSAPVVQPAIDAQRTGPRTLRTGVLALLAGLVLAVMAAVVADAVSRRVRDPSELRDLLGTEWLGRLPAPARRDRRGPRLILPRDGSSRYGESVRLLRASLERATDLSARPTLAFTSPREREGRTTTVANVAYALASTGLRVVAVDLDLRRPMLHAAFDLPNDVGVVECLKGAGAETALQRVEMQRPGVRNRPSGGGLWVLPAGSVPADPGGFLDSRELGGLLAGLRSWADVLVLDTGPLLGSADVIVLSRHVDAMVLLVSARRTTRSGALEAAAAAAQCACPVLGHVTCDDAPPLRRRSSTPQRTTPPPATRAGGEAPEPPRSVAPEGQAAP